MKIILLKGTLSKNTRNEGENSVSNNNIVCRRKDVE